MKWDQKMFCLAMVLCIMVSGCGRKHTQNAAGSNVATQVEIHSITPAETVSRFYTQPAKIEAVLIYLRLLRPRGPVRLPEKGIDNYYEIIVHLSDGSSRMHRQCADQYATSLQGWWGIIDRRYGQQLSRLIQYIPSDTEPKKSLQWPVTPS